MIDYTLIGEAVNYYESKCNYKYIDVPWFISLDTMLITRPKGARLFSTFAGELVASGEQSFLEMRGELKPGKYQCVTPCFRDEPIDKYHLQYFMKNELIWIPDFVKYYNSKEMVEQMIDEALVFFKRYSKENLPYVIDEPIKNSIINKDIKIAGIEVGSYGFRNYENFSWVYGTGCAEPRLTQALEVPRG